MEEKETIREYRLKNRRISIYFRDNGLIHVKFRRLLPNVNDLNGNEVNPPYNYILKPKLSNKCVFVTNIDMTKEAFKCMAHFFVNNLNEF